MLKPNTMHKWPKFKKRWPVEIFKGTKNMQMGLLKLILQAVVLTYAKYVSTKTIYFFFTIILNVKMFHFRLVQGATWHRKCLRGLSVLIEMHFYVLTCMHVAWFSGSLCPGAQQQMVSVSRNHDIK